MGIKNPKGGTVKGSNMHNFYYNSSGNSIKEIRNYCEEDVMTTIELVKKVKEL
jgi:predicted PolB exonuclease-like 3'-5' exonuclease